MSRSLGSQLSAGTSHQLKIAMMVTAPRITIACRSNRRKVDQTCVFAKEAVGFGRTHKIEGLGRDGEEERRDFGHKRDGIEQSGDNIKGFGEWAQLELRPFEFTRGHEQPQ